MNIILPVCVVCSVCGVVHVALYRKRKGLKVNKASAITGMLLFLLLAVLSVSLLAPIGPGSPAPIRLVPFQTISGMLNDCLQNGIFDKAVLDGGITLYNFAYILNHSARNLLANVIFFFPIGFLMALHVKNIKMSVSAVISVAIPVFVELWQLLIAKGRTFDVDDIILNFIGIFIGFSTVIIYRNHRRKNDKRNNGRNQ